MLKHNILHVEHYHNDHSDVWVCKRGYEILKIANESTNIPRTEFTHLQNACVCVCVFVCVCVCVYSLPP